MIKITDDVKNKIVEHAIKGAPLEVCGYLAGTADIISKHYELTNADNSEEHYSFIPEEQFAALKDARKNGMELLAVYHSHPATPARMSEEDIKLAFDPNISYLIVSLSDGVNIKSFKVKNGEVTTEEVEIVK